MEQVDAALVVTKAEVMRMLKDPTSEDVKRLARYAKETRRRQAAASKAMHKDRASAELMETWLAAMKEHSESKTYLDFVTKAYLAKRYLS